MVVSTGDIARAIGSVRGGVPTACRAWDQGCAGRPL